MAFVTRLFQGARDLLTLTSNPSALRDDARHSNAHATLHTTTATAGSRKRAASDISIGETRKRVRTTGSSQPDETLSDSDSTSSGPQSPSIILSHANSGEWDTVAHRGLMPPPSLTMQMSWPGSRIYHLKHDVGDASSDASFTARSNKQRLQPDTTTEYDMEKARRHAAATTLPPNSGIWERGEKELFYHLSYRGFEPLLPKNWMKDFPTLPLSLYANHDDQIPLIRNGRTREFRAIRELRDLIEVGKNVRDRVLASPVARSEQLIEKASKQYISWALADAGIRVPPRSRSAARTSNGTLPIHVIVTLKTGQNTHDCLLELKSKLHKLAARHREIRNIHVSVERDRDATTPEDEETFIADARDDDLPVLYGLMICSSILAVLTMNSHTSQPKSMSGNRGNLLSARKGRSIPPRSPDSHESSPSQKADRTQPVPSSPSIPRNTNVNLDVDTDVNTEDSISDPRFISNFDFSDPSRDVWNALVIAIVAMQIRSDMLRLHSALGMASHEEHDSVLGGMDVDEYDELSLLGRAPDVSMGQVEDDPDL